MAQVSEELDRYLVDFERFEQDGATRAASWVHELRKAAIARFAELGFPTTRHEEWKYTAVAPITKVPFTRVGYEGPVLPSGALERFSFGLSEGARGSASGQGASRPRLTGTGQRVYFPATSRLLASPERLPHQQACFGS